MKRVMPIWEGPLSPVFDSARRLLIVVVEDGVEVDRLEVPHALGWVGRMGPGGCGCPHLRGHISGTGNSTDDSRNQGDLRITGKVDKVLAAYLDRQPSNSQFVMPGHQHMGVNESECAFEPAAQHY